MPNEKENKFLDIKLRFEKATNGPDTGETIKQIVSDINQIKKESEKVGDKGYINDLNNRVKLSTKDIVRKNASGQLITILNNYIFSTKDLADIYIYALSIDPLPKSLITSFSHFINKLDNNQKKEFNLEVNKFIEKEITKSNTYKVLEKSFLEVRVDPLNEKDKKYDNNAYVYKSDKAPTNKNSIKAINDFAKEPFEKYSSYKGTADVVTKIIQELVIDKIDTAIKNSRTETLVLILKDTDSKLVDLPEMIKLFDQTASKAVRALRPAAYENSAEQLFKYLNAKGVSANLMMKSHLGFEAAKFCVSNYNADPSYYPDSNKADKEVLMNLVKKKLLTDLENVGFNSKDLDKEQDASLKNRKRNEKPEEFKVFTESFGKLNKSYEDNRKIYANLDKKTGFITEIYSTEVEKLFTSMIIKGEKASVTHILKNINKDLFTHDLQVKTLNLAAKYGKMDIADLILSTPPIKANLIADKGLNIDARKLLVINGADPKDLKPIKGHLTKAEISELKAFKQECDKFEKGLYREEKKLCLEIVKSIKTQQHNFLGGKPLESTIINNLKKEIPAAKDISDENLHKLYEISKSSLKEPNISKSVLDKISDFVTEIFKSGKDLFKDSKGKTEIRVAKAVLSNGIKGEQILKETLPSMSKKDLKALTDAVKEIAKSNASQEKRDHKVKDHFESKLKDEKKDTIKLSNKTLPKKSR